MPRRHHSFTGIDGLKISDTICDAEVVEPLPALLVDEPTISMTSQVNHSPLAAAMANTSSAATSRTARRGTYPQRRAVSRAGGGPGVQGLRPDELHLAGLIENMRREGYELDISRPEATTRPSTATRRSRGRR